MQGEKQVYHIKLDSSGRLLIPSDLRERHKIGAGDTLVIAEDDVGLRVKTLDEVIAEAQAYFARFVPRDVLLSEEILQDRRSEIERD